MPTRNVVLTEHLDEVIDQLVETVNDDDVVIMASEVGVLPIPESRILKKWRLQPGKMFLIDTEQGRIIDDAELKQQLASSKPYKEWIKRIDKLAKDMDLGVIDMHKALEDKPQLLPDRVHPNTEGAGEMARAAYKALTGKKAPEAVAK